MARALRGAGPLLITDFPPPDQAADAGRTQDVRLRQLRQALLEAVARHHHGGPATVASAPRPW